MEEATLNKKQIRRKKPKKHYQKKTQLQYAKKFKIMEETKEEGFTGHSSTWFDDEKFFADFIGEMGAPKKKGDEDYYFGSYSHFHIHEEMLKDQTRTKTYMLACMRNKNQFKDKIVLDVGCGTGILGLFALRAGAKHVYAVDNADIAHYAKEIAKQNGYEDQFTVFKAKVEEVELPVPNVDIIISEWMGYFLLYESMLDCVLFARDKWLVQDGLILPDKITLNFVAIEDEQYKREKFGFWDSVYGVNMTCIKNLALSEPLVDIIERPLVMSNICPFFQVDLYTVKVEDLEFATQYSLKINRDDTIHALGGWFDVYFSKLNDPVQFSTSPFNTPTHWKQTVFYLDQPIKAKKDDILHGSIAVRKGLVNFRDLDIKISFHVKGNDNPEENYDQMYKLR